MTNKLLRYYEIDVDFFSLEFYLKYADNIVNNDINRNRTN